MLFSQEHEIAKVQTDSSDSAEQNIQQNDTTWSFVLKKRLLRQPTLSPLRISDKQRFLNFDISPNRFRNPSEATNWDALNMPTKRLNYEMTGDYLTPLFPIVPFEKSPEDGSRLLSIHDYFLPTRQELDILEILWIHEDVMDTTIYSCLDYKMNITMALLNRLLNTMHRKGLVRRKQVSPRFEFNAFGVLIEMSPTNIRNRVYSYNSNVDRDLMRRFIDANAYLFKEDSSIVDQDRLRAAREDSTLLNDLNFKLNLPD